MGVNYLLYGEDFNKYSDTLDKEELVEMEILDQRDKLWRKAQVMLFQKPMEGAEPVALLGPVSAVYDEGKYYMKIMKLLPEEEE